MKKITAILLFTFLSGVVYNLPLEAAPKHSKNDELNPNGFNSAECKNESRFKDYKKSNPAFYALMAHLCNWSSPLMPLNVRSYRGLWAKIANGESVSTHDIKEFESLIKAKELYDELSQKKTEYALPILGFDPSDMLYSMIENGKLNLLKETQLKFYLKLYDCNLADADIDSVSGNAFSQMFKFSEEGAVLGLHQNSGEILRKVFELEKKYWAKKKAKSDVCTEEFNSSPLQLFSEAISISLKQDIEINPKSTAAVELSEKVRGLAEEFNGKVVTPEMDETIKSLSKSINMIQGNAPKKK